MEFPPVAPFTCHVTAVLFAFCTVAVNCWLCPAWREAEVGEMEIASGGGAVMVTLAELDLVESACETAVTLTVDGLGTTGGAV